MNTAETGKSREGKYCPRCRTMTFRDREVCEHCGHQFRTGMGVGLGAPPLDAPITDEAMLHRTMQFTLPPLSPRGVVAAPEADTTAPLLPRRRGVLVPALAAGFLGIILLCAWAYHTLQTARAARPSPVGVWDTEGGRASQDARLRFVFREGGDGSFAWAASGPPPLSGQTPLHWRLNPDGRLVLTIIPPASAPDPVSGPLIAVFRSQPWLWHVDRSRHRLIIGPLSLTETT